MTAEELIKKSIIDRCAKNKIKPHIGLRVADAAIEKFRKNQFKGKASKLVDDAVTEAKKLGKKEKK